MTQARRPPGETRRLLLHNAWREPFILSVESVNAGVARKVQIVTMPPASPCRPWSRPGADQPILHRSSYTAICGASRSLLRLPDTCLPNFWRRRPSDLKFRNASGRRTGPTHEAKPAAFAGQSAQIRDAEPHVNLKVGHWLAPARAWALITGDQTQRYCPVAGIDAINDAMRSANSSPNTGFRSSEKVALIAPPIASAVVSCA